MLITFVLGVVTASMASFALSSLQMTQRDVNRTQALYHAEAALQVGIQRIAASGATSPVGDPVSTSTDTASVFAGYYPQAKIDTVDWARVEVTLLNADTDTYRVRGFARVNDVGQGMEAVVQRNPVSEVFDNEYFLNNWGWWWGSSITGNGPNRSNWDFDFRYTPTVNGMVYAHGQIESNLVPIDIFGNTQPPVGGLAGANPDDYFRIGTRRVPMPTLKDMSYYMAMATERGGTLRQVGKGININAVHNDASQPGLFLQGTLADPIIIDGPVVIPGDVVISGYVKGQGSVYAGGNLYITNSLQYVNGPSYSSPPSTMTDENRDAWVLNNQGKDLIAWAAKESILIGDVNHANWKSNCYDNNSYGLKLTGAEGNLGRDGIPDTPDDGVPYRDLNGDGVLDSAWYDVDGDGNVDTAMNYASQIQLTTSRIGKILGWPTTATGTPVATSAVAVNTASKIEGVFYTNHALGARTGNLVINGSVICSHEAIVFQSIGVFTYDERVHSRYSNDPNRVVDLGLPVTERVRLLELSRLSVLEGEGHGL